MGNGKGKPTRWLSSYHAPEPESTASGEEWHEILDPVRIKKLHHLDPIVAVSDHADDGALPLDPGEVDRDDGRARPKLCFPRLLGQSGRTACIARSRAANIREPCRLGLQ